MTKGSIYLVAGRLGLGYWPIHLVPCTKDSRHSLLGGADKGLHRRQVSPDHYQNCIYLLFALLVASLVLHYGLYSSMSLGQPLKK